MPQWDKKTLYPTYYHCRNPQSITTTIDLKRHLIPRKIQVEKFKKTNPSTKIQVVINQT